MAASAPNERATADTRRLVLRMRGITKRFGALVANDAVDFDLREGEVHALLGENGAGKSTLMCGLYGLEPVDAGTVELFGASVDLRTPAAAIAQGIGMVHQHFMLIPVLTVAENVVLGAEPGRMRLDRRHARDAVLELGERYGLAVDPDRVVGDLTVGEQQRVEILRALYRGARILILDEPTAVLTSQETEQLFAIVRALTAKGTAVVLISHKLREVLEIADRVTILRRGRKIATMPRRDATERGLVEAMVGREVLMRLAKTATRPGSPRLTVERLTVCDDRGIEAVRELSLTVRAGEIVGLAGVDGNGQAELVEALTGLRRARSGSIEVDGRPLAPGDVRAAVAAGIGYIAEDRHRRGLVLDFELAENLCLRSYRQAPIARLGWMSHARVRARAHGLLEEFDVRGGDSDTPARALSGGNQQKVVIARELAGDPAVLVAARPTRGLDIGATEFVRKRLLAARAAGRAVLLISYELEEISALADRILVIYEGRLVAEFAPDTSEEQLGFAMAGGGDARRHQLDDDGGVR